MGPIVLCKQALSELFRGELAYEGVLETMVGGELEIVLYFILELVYLFPEGVGVALELIVFLDDLVVLLVVVTHAVENCLVGLVFCVAFVQLFPHLVQPLLQHLSAPTLRPLWALGRFALLLQYFWLLLWLLFEQAACDGLRRDVFLQLLLL